MFCALKGRMLALLVCSAASASAQTQPAPTAALGAVLVDAVAVRFSAPEMGGIDHPRFIFRRALSFEARLEALADPTFSVGQVPYTGAHARAALERHIAETILESLEVSPVPSASELQARVEATRLALFVRAGGAQAVDEAARAEGLEPYEVLRIVQRQARASLYLDRMVAPMLDPSEPELRNLHAAGRTPFSKRPFAEVEQALRRWIVARRLREAVLNYYDGARSRVTLQVL